MVKKKTVINGASGSAIDVSLVALLLQTVVDIDKT